MDDSQKNRAEEPDKPQTENSTESQPNSDPGQLDNAVNDIVRHESDEVLEAEDTKSDSLAHPKRPWYKKKKLYIPVLVIIVLVAVFLVPATRYPILGLLWKNNYQIKVIDSQTGQPVTDAMVSLDGKTISTDNQGKTTLHVKVGKGSLIISKKYYANDSTTVLVPLRVHGPVSFSLKATGRQVPISLVNKIGGAPIANAVIAAAGTKATTNSSGKANLVLPADKTSETATITSAGFNDLSTNVTVTTKVVATNNFQLVPSGNVYFLSNASGNIDVVKTNLDGSGLAKVIAGTGFEDPNDTFILPSSDWKYIALISNRTSSTNTPDLYLINTSTGLLSEVDSGNASFTFNGWTASDYLVYTAGFSNVPPGTNGAQVLKTVNASNDKLTTLDTTNGQTLNSSNISESYDSVNVLSNNTVLYLKSWQGDTSLFPNLQSTLTSSQPNGGSKAVLKSFSEDTYYPFINSTAAGPNSVYYYVSPMSGDTATLDFEYSNGAVQQLSGESLSSANTTQATPITYFTSPSGKSTLWASAVNGHNAIMVGNSTAGSPSQVALLDSTYTVYGWYTDNYILLSKNNDELYIMPVGGVANTNQLIKISNYL